MQVSAYYVRPNISRNARDRTAAFFKVLSVLAEIFVFSYIGTTCTPSPLLINQVFQSKCAHNFLNLFAVFRLLELPEVDVAEIYMAISERALLMAWILHLDAGTSITINVTAWKHGITWTTLVRPRTFHQLYCKIG